MNRILKIIGIVMAGALIGLVVPLTGCSEPESEMSESQIVTVQRGDLTIDITAAGNLALSRTEDLAFEMAGTVEEVMVEEGDSVKDGQLLAKLDTSEWDKELTNLEMALVQADINLRNAELALEQAEEPYSDEDIDSAEAAVDSAEASLEYAEWQLDEAEDLGDEELIRRYQSEVIKAEASLASAEAKLEEMEDAPDSDDVRVAELQLELAEARFEDAEEALAEAFESSPEIIAFFDGFITAVNVEGGDEVLKGTVAVIIADPDEFEADILVSEMDIPQIELGDTASVVVDALDITVPAEVIHISPTATIQSGVVNYTVRVKLQSLETVIQEQQAALANIQLREGLTVTVSLVVEEATDVLLVPNGAINSRGQQAYVQVPLDDGSIEQRVVIIGISDWQYTEVIDGLSEGEEVVVPEGTAAATSTTQQRGGPGGNMIMMPATGRPR